LIPNYQYPITLMLTVNFYHVTPVSTWYSTFKHFTICIYQKRQTLGVCFFWLLL